MSTPLAVRRTTSWKVTLAYDGTDYRGWQVQPGLATIQGELVAAIERVTSESVLPQGSGRTDAGVHALAQVASFALAAPIPPANLMRALNRTLPAAIRVLSAQEMPGRFHARHHAVRKTYEYRVLVCDPYQQQVCPPWIARYVCAVERPLSLGAMKSAAQCILGEHDFTSFAAFDPDRSQRILLAEQNAEEGEAAGTPPTNIRRIEQADWTLEQQAGLPLFVFRVSGNGFLHHMVRNLVGLFLPVGWGERTPAEIPQILEARNRSAAGRTAPAKGLFLHHVDY